MLAPNNASFTGQLLIITCLWLYLIAIYQCIDIGNITRKQNGDMFVLNDTACSKSACLAFNGTLWHQWNTSSPKDDDPVSVSTTSCSCVCPKDRPLFRDDHETCANDISECSVAQYSVGAPVQFIPFIFLPLKGQIIHPSKEISFPGVRTPVCAVSGAQFLTRRGLADLRNAIDADVPFTLFRDEGRTFLQWTGDPELRERMVGKLLLVRLLCRDVSISTSSSGGTVDLRGVFTPCVAFRVQGSPVTQITNVSEVLFSPDAQSSNSSSPSGLTTQEYVAIGVSSVLLGLIYVASVFLYLHLKKRRIQNSIADAEKAKQRRPTISSVTNKQDVIRGLVLQDRTADINLSGTQEGVVKNNPLLSREHKHFFERDKANGDFANENEGNATDSEDAGDCDDSTDRLKKLKITSALVHENNQERLSHLSSLTDVYCSRDETGIERLPEENVSIIETMDGRDDRPEMFRIIGTARKKLYFNPAYFEPHLLLDPPPAAIEFLTKIREVISVAKQKMATKRFQPILHEIPEEDTYHTINLANEFHYGPSSHRSSNISLKRENTRKRVLCSGCPGCDLIEQQYISDSLLQLSDLVVCQSCSNARGERQNSVRKWLDNMPLSDQTLAIINPQSNLIAEFSKKSLFYKDHFTAGSGLFTSKSLYNGNVNNFSFKVKSASQSVRSEPSFRSYNFSLPHFHTSGNSEDAHNIGGFTIAKTEDIRPITPSFRNKKRISEKEIKPNDTKEVQNIMPDMINEALAIDKENKKSMGRKNGKNFKKIDEKACIDRLESLQNNIQNIDYETDSLERTTNNRGLSSSSPTDFGELSSSQASPSLSTALPIEEEMTIRNAVYTSNLSSRSSDSPPSIDSTNVLPDYEEIGKAPKLKRSIDHSQNVSKMNSKDKDYSLVSEVYVNNDYNFGSTPSSPSGSNSSVGSRKVMIRYEDPEKKPGRLTIEVPNPPGKYLVHSESDSFEPDTLDRKHSKFEATILTKQEKLYTYETRSNIEKTVEENLPFKFNRDRKFDRPKKESICNSQNTNGNKIVQEIESFYLSDIDKIFDKTKELNYIEENMDDEGRVLTLELRHSKRQRQLTPPYAKGSKKIVPPDVVPPLLTADNIYEQPKPPKRYMGNEQPPLPPKNDFGRSNSPRKTMLTNAGGYAPSDLCLLPVRPSCSLVSASVKNNRPSDIHLEERPPAPPPRNNLNQRAQGTQTGDTINRKATEPSKEDSINHKVRIHVKESNTLKSVAPKRIIRDGKHNDSTGTEVIRKSWRKPSGHQQKEDSGYLSSDSSPSQRVIRKRDRRHSCSETDSSEYEAQSESGAESIETHSVFFGSLRKLTLMSNPGKNIPTQPHI